jgi:hypothetical protein
MWPAILQLSGESGACSFADPDPHYFGAGPPDPHQSKNLNPDPYSLFRSFRGFKWSRGELKTLKMEPWRTCRPVIADSHHFDQELIPDPRIHNPGCIHVVFTPEVAH